MYLTIVCRLDVLWRGMRCQLGTVALASDTSLCLVDSDCTVNRTVFTDCVCRCVIVRGNEVISKGHNQTNMTKNVRFLVPTFAILHATCSVSQSSKCKSVALQQLYIPTKRGRRKIIDMYRQR